MPEFGGVTGITANLKPHLSSGARAQDSKPPARPGAFLFREDEVTLDEPDAPNSLQRRAQEFQERVVIVVCCDAVPHKHFLLFSARFFFAVVEAWAYLDQPHQHLSFR